MILCLQQTDMYLCRLFNHFQTTFRTIHGQCLDVCTASPSEMKVDMSRFTMERYSAIVKYKTAFYSFQLPVALAFYLVRSV